MKCVDCAFRNTALTYIDGTCLLFGKMYYNGYHNGIEIISCKKGIEKKVGRKIITWYDLKEEKIKYEVRDMRN